jgi:nicotinic acid mononucleotide adenylyltransferase
LIEISSTDIRKKAAGGQSVKYYLPERVEALIQEKKIYSRGGR